MNLSCFLRDFKLIRDSWTLFQTLPNRKHPYLIPIINEFLSIINNVINEAVQKENNVINEKLMSYDTTPIALR